MGQNNYTVAIEIGSSKISGAVSIETYECKTMILAATSIPADGFISRGTVRNVDKTSEAINCIINNLEDKLGDGLQIKRAYVSLAGLTLHSIPSKITRCFETHTKITTGIIEEMEVENDALFQAPEGYIKVRGITQEYRMDGKTERTPIGMPALNIEGNYLNIVVKEQYFNQLKESFRLVGVDIEDSFVAARLEAETRLSDEERRNGCALVDFGAETTTIAIYNNSNLRKLIVLPLGSMNITRDLCAENIAFDKAEEIKFTRGYKSPSNDNEAVDIETVNNIIYARCGEILQNVKFQIEESGEIVRHVAFVGGGSKLKNFQLLLDEFLPDFKTEIKPAPQFNLQCAPGVNTTETFSATLYGLLNIGKENCCEKEMPVKPVNNGNLFPEENEPEPEIIVNVSENTEEERDIKRLEKEQKEKEERARKEEEKRRKEEEKRLKEEEKRRKKEEERIRKENERKEKGPGFIGSLFDNIRSFVTNATSDESDEHDERDNENEDDNTTKRINNK